MRFGSRSAAAAALLALVPACSGGTSQAAAASPDVLREKMAAVQEQFATEQAVLDKQKDSLLNIVSGGGPGAGAPPSLFEVLRDPTILLEAAGDGAEATAVDTLTGAWTAHADAWCAQDPATRDDDFFLVYGGAHVLPALVAFLDTYCGADDAAALVAAAKSHGLGQGMAASGDPSAGIDLDALLERLND